MCNPLEITFLIHNGGKLKLSENVVYQLQKYAQTEHCASEAGGILLGRYILDAKDIVVDKITIPMEEDQSGRYHFFRKQKAHQSEIEKNWKASKGTCNYLGEWHTHPEPDPTPSDQDISNWKRILKKSYYDNEHLYFLIVGTLKINVWEGVKKNSTITKLNTMDSNKTIISKEEKMEEKNSAPDLSFLSHQNMGGEL